MRFKTYAALAPFFVFFQAGVNEPPPFTVNGGDQRLRALVANLKARNLNKGPKPGTWLKFDRMPLLRHTELYNQPWKPEDTRPVRPPKIPKGWVAMTEEVFVRELLGSMA